MNRITRERLKKQRAAKGFTGIQIKDLGKFFKRKEMQAPTPSGVTKKKTTTTKPTATKTTPTKTTKTRGGNEVVTPKATDAEVKAWKARKPNSMKPETWKGYRNVGAALNAWRKEDPRKK